MNYLLRSAADLSSPTRARLASSLKGGLIDESFTDKVVFLTGGTGFVGQAILLQLEKLPVAKVFCLVRGEDPTARLRKLGVADPRFIAVRGDVGEKNLGIKNTDEFVGKIDYVIHSAANTRFDKGLKEIYEDNVISSFYVAEFAFITARVKKQFVYISTTYVNWFRENHEIAHELVNMDPSFAKKELSVNTYTHTKASAERMLSSMFAGYGAQVLIARFATVGHALHEPFPGWMTNASPIGVFLNSPRGPVKANQDFGLDVIPVDLSANMLLTHMAYQGKSRENVVVVHIGSGSRVLNNVRLFDKKFKLSENISGAVMDKFFTKFTAHQVVFDDKATQMLLNDPEYQNSDKVNFPMDVSKIDHESYMMLPRTHMLEQMKRHQRAGL